MIIRQHNKGAIENANCTIEQGSFVGDALISDGETWLEIKFSGQAVMDYHPTEKMDGYTIWQAYAEIVDIENLEYSIIDGEGLTLSHDEIADIVDYIVFNYDLGAVA